MKLIFEKPKNIIFTSTRQYIENELNGYKSFLDVGCGINTPIQNYSKQYYSVGVDAFEPSIEDSRKKGPHTEYKLMDVLSIGEKFKENSFDCVVALDLIEHLEKDEGARLIKMMEKIAKKKVIIFTPNAFLPQKQHSGNPLQIHKSGWEAKEMMAYGYKVIGINGYKHLKGEMAEIKWHPTFIWNIISNITQIFVKNRPSKAFQLLCTKIL